MAHRRQSCSFNSRPMLREIHNDSRFNNGQSNFNASMVDSKAFCKTTFVNSTRWANELRRADSTAFRDVYEQQNKSNDLCRSRSAHLSRQRTIDTARPRRSVSWADDLVNVHTYTRPKQRRQSGWQILRRKMSQVMKAIREDIDF